MAFGSDLAERLGSPMGEPRRMMAKTNELTR